MIFIQVRMLSHQRVLIVDGNSSVADEGLRDSVSRFDTGVGWTGRIFNFYWSDRRPDERSLWGDLM